MKEQPKKLDSLIGILQSTWDQIRANHPDCGESIIDQIHIGSNSVILYKRPESILCTLLHDACHSIARNRGIQDASRQGRYHNRKFATIAEEVGLVATHEKGDKVGYRTESLAEGTAVRYGVQLELLSDVLSVYQDWDTGKPKTPRKKQPYAECDCGRKIRASKKTLEEGEIHCGLCGECFVYMED